MPNDRLNAVADAYSDADAKTHTEPAGDNDSGTCKLCGAMVDREDPEKARQFMKSFSGALGK